jgi:alkyl hydroperoxide reductase subunit AhpC
MVLSRWDNFSFECPNIEVFYEKGLYEHRKTGVRIFVVDIGNKYVEIKWQNTTVVRSADFIKDYTPIVDPKRIIH